eukprot:4963610-Alexandrium_andersonii.AAC.1
MPASANELLFAIELVLGAEKRTAADGGGRRFVAQSLQMRHWPARGGPAAQTGGPHPSPPRGAA